MASASSFEIQGHRGARGLLPENTLPSFQRALELGVATLEMDVVISGDGEVIVSHEPWFHAAICSLPSGAPVPRSTQRSYRIYEMTVEEIQAFDCGMRGNPAFPDQKPMRVYKPTLREVISLAESFQGGANHTPIRYSIEVKSKRRWEGRYQPDPATFVRLIGDVLQECHVGDRTALLSFDRRILQEAKKADVGWDIALLIPYFPRKRLQRHLSMLGFIPDIFSPDHRLVSPQMITGAHEAGMRIIPWTVNDAQRMALLRSHGVDGLITDYPDRALGVLRSGDVDG